MNFGGNNMKALIFNHHPDYTWQLQKTLNYLGIDCYLATEELTFNSGAEYCSSSSDFKLRTGPIWYTEEELFGEKVFKYKDNFEDIDYVFTMNAAIAKKIDFNPKKLFFCACVSWDLSGMNDSNKYVKITSHHAASNFGANYIPYYVPQRGDIKEKKYIIQLIEGFQKTPYYDELLNLKNNGYPVIIAGSENAPDGVVNDWNMLSYSTLLVHHKDYGTNCNAVMKALDSGVPCYMSRENKLTIGMGDLPDDLFIYSNDYTLIDAYNLSFNIDNKKIQSTFREIRNTNKTSEYLKKIL
jgi:hypothetical protein